MNAADLIGIRGAVATVALSHPETCRCTVCCAAAGDTQALAKIVIDTLEAGQ